MARFKITTPVRDFHGESAGVRFHGGTAEIDTASDLGVSQLSYFRGAGYGIEPLSGVEVDDALRAATLDPTAEAAEIKAEIDKLNDRLKLDELREQRDKLREQVGKREVEVEQTADDHVDLSLPAPPDSDKLTEWRAYAVANLGVTETQAKAMNVGELRGLYDLRKSQGGAK